MGKQGAKDYYALLGVPREASAEEIKRAYRKSARRWHPDMNPGDPQAEQRFKEIGEAYDVLSDPEKRKRYDLFGDPDAPGFSGFEGFSPGGFDGGFGTEGFGTGGIDIEDLFGSLFGGGPRDARAPLRGGDLQVRMNVTLEEVLHGGARILQVGRDAPCRECDGIGVRKGASPAVCPQCRGIGTVEQARGAMRARFTCPRCHGTGGSVPACAHCGGAGSVPRAEQVEVKIPPGIASGAKLRVPGKGNAGAQGAPPGDLYVTVDVLPHPRLERKGNDLYESVSLPLMTAALGGTLRVQGPYGPKDLSIPAGTQGGQRFRLRGEGVPHHGGGGRGDYYVRVNIEVPKNLTPRQRELFEELKKEFEN